MSTKKTSKRTKKTATPKEAWAAIEKLTKSQKETGEQLKKMSREVKESLKGQ